MCPTAKNGYVSLSASAIPVVGALPYPLRQAGRDHVRDTMLNEMDWLPP